MIKKRINDHFTNWLQGNDQAFDIILDYYYPRLMAATQQMVTVKEDAEELVMNVFLKIWQHRNQLSHVLKFDDYLFGILRQQIVRRARKNVLNLESLEDQPISTLGITDHPELYLKELQIAYQLALNKLHPRQREVFVYSREHEMSQQEIADKLQLSVSTVNNHITSALKVLRRELNDYPDTVVILILANMLVIPLSI